MSNEYIEAEIVQSEPLPAVIVPTTTSEASLMNDAIDTYARQQLLTKITNPSGGTTGQVLKKTATGEEWANNEAIDSVARAGLLTKMDNPTGEKLVAHVPIVSGDMTTVHWGTPVDSYARGQLDTKLNNPSNTGTTGQVLTKTDSGHEWSTIESGGVPIVKVNLVNDSSIIHGATLQEEIDYEELYTCIHTKGFPIVLLYNNAGTSILAEGLMTDAKIESTAGSRMLQAEFHSKVGAVNGWRNYIGDMLLFTQNSANNVQYCGSELAMDGVQNSGALSSTTKVPTSYLVSTKLNEKMNNPSNAGTTSQVLTKTANGHEWADAPTVTDAHINELIDAKVGTLMTGALALEQLIG